MKNKTGLFALLAIVAILVASVVVAASSDLTVEEVEINGDEIDFTFDERFAVQEGETLDIEVRLSALTDVEDVRVTAEISGYEYSDYQNLYDATHLFDVDADSTKFVDLSLDLPRQMDNDEYWLRLRVTDKNSETYEQTIRLLVEPVRHGLDIADVVFSPGNVVQSGRSLLTTVLVQNYGDNVEQDVKVTVSIPALGIQAVDYISEVELEGASEYVSYETSEELFLRIPECAAEGTYQVDVTVQYDEYEFVTNSYSVAVTQGSTCNNGANRLVVGVGPQVQNVQAGSSAVYAVALSNEGTNTETFTLNLVTGDWAQASLSESVIVLGAGQSAVVYANVETANDASGTQVANLVISNEGSVLESIALTANVEGSSASSGINLRNGLELALIVLVVLVIVLGLLIGFARLRKDEDEEQTYY